MLLLCSTHISTNASSESHTIMTPNTAHFSIKDTNTEHHLSYSPPPADMWETNNCFTNPAREARSLLKFLPDLAPSTWPN